MSARLDVGGGARPTPTAGWIEYDRWAWPTTVTGDIVALPFRSGSVEHVHCAHVLEHIPLTDVPAALSELRRVMAVDGLLYVAGPDFDRTRVVGPEQWRHYTRRGGTVKGWEHRWVCGVRRLYRLLIDAGFAPVWATGVPQGWPLNSHGWPPDLEARFLCRRDDFPWPTWFPYSLPVLK